MRHRQMTLCIKLLVELFEAVFFFFRRKWLSCASATLKRTTKHWMDVIDDVLKRSPELPRCHGESRHPQCYWSSHVFFSAAQATTAGTERPSASTPKYAETQRADLPSPGS